MTEQDLLEKKEEIDIAKERIAEMKGEEKALLKQLQDEFKVGTLPAAKKKIESFEGKAKKLAEKIETETTKLEETYFKEED